MKRRWIIVEDDQRKWRAYVRSFIEIYGESNPLFNDEVTFLVFKNDDEKEFNEIVRKLPLLNCKRIHANKDIVNYVNSAKEWAGGIIVVLDFLLPNHDTKQVLQDKSNVASNWNPIERRVGDDIICLVTSEYNNKDYLNQFNKKGFLGPREITGDDIQSRIAKAKENIFGAHHEWTDRYDHPGKKLLHALMLAQPIGNEPGHIEGRHEIYVGFPFKDALLSDDFCLRSFKSLFYHTGPDKADDFTCHQDTLSKILLECGLGCEIVASGKGDCIKLPMSPGALYLFRLCYLVRMLRDETYSNPVVKIEILSASEKFVTKLFFEKSVFDLKLAFTKNGGGQTVPLLRTFEICCVPITPSCDQALHKTFEIAALSSPNPREEHIDKVRAMVPVLVNNKNIKVMFEDTAILFEQVY